MVIYSEFALDFVIIVLHTNYLAQIPTGCEKKALKLILLHDTQFSWFCA